MELFSNLSLLKKYSNDSTKFKGQFITLQKEVLDFYDNFDDDPIILSGWGHNYFCEQDGGKLIFNLKTPKSHICEVCGNEYSSKKYNSTWVYMYRYRAFEIAYKAAIIYKIKNDSKMLEIIVGLLIFYATNYSNFKVHAKDKINVIENGVTGFGKIMPQGLNEAIMLTSIINTLLIVSSDISSDDKKIIDSFVNNITLFLFDQRKAYHNIICWIDCAITCSGIYLDNIEYIDSGLNSKYGLINQLNHGLTKDYFWYEGSLHYHFFTVEALLNLLLVSEISNYKIESIKEFTKQMLISASEVAFDNLVLPNPNDGWPNISLKTYSHLFEIANKVFDDIQIWTIVNKIRTSNLQRQKLPLCEPIFLDGLGLNRLLFSKDFNTKEMNHFTGKSKNFKSSGFAVIKNEYFNMFFKHGHKSQSHAHPDLGNFELTIKDKIITRDLSNPGYGAVLYDEWYKKTLAHNTVIIGGKDQEYSESSNVLKYTDSGIHAKFLGCYKDVELNRRIILDGNTVYDHFIVNKNSDDISDYIVHLEAEQISNLNTTDGDILFNSNGYEHLKDVKRVISKKSQIDIKWSKDYIKFTTRFFIKDKEMFICKSYDNPSNKFRNTIILRSNGKNIQYEMLIIAE
ncbi:MAG: heparinase II/III-family protein [Spirochaetaceae bacterium]